MGRLKKIAKQPGKTLPKLVRWPPTFKLRVFTASNITLEEVAINNVVLRVPLKSIGIKRTKGRPRKTPRNNLTQSKLKTSDTKSPTKQIPSRPSPKTNNGAASNNQQALTLNNTKKPSFVYANKRKKVSKPVSPKLGFEQYPGASDSQSKLTVDFTELSEVVSAIKLPSPTWQVTVLMNHDLTTVFKFTNNPIKFVTFSEPNSLSNIMMYDVPVTLLGCPKTVDSMQDLEILLEIVDRLDLKDCMVRKLQYL